MKRFFAALLLTMMLLTFAAPALAEMTLPHGDMLAVYDELLRGTWALLDGGTRLRGLPTSFTYGVDAGYFLFVTADCRVCLAWINPAKGMMLLDQYAEVAFSADGQTLLLFRESEASVFVRQPD